MASSFPTIFLPGLFSDGVAGTPLETSVAHEEHGLASAPLEASCRLCLPLSPMASKRLCWSWRYTQGSPPRRHQLRLHANPIFPRETVASSQLSIIAWHSWGLDCWPTSPSPARLSISLPQRRSCTLELSISPMGIYEHVTAKLSYHPVLPGDSQ
ncbi:hypothetical protein BS50DRAFT_338556 [Corynespora cassiicola Philippines]|uniref:Uncharacterized protein n=1 Tax=Corynespora cassiicola Philippines TaxID=1448308 RepID=A0A2T2NV59_CORCC|nr:hypothetical protein BS50DRAFT_338556 [Corynespora cassiicola Philippines]